MTNERADFLPQRRWLGSKGLLIACGVIGLVLIIAWFVLTFLALRRVPALAGGVSIKANPGVRIYVGERLFANGNVSLTWDELMREDAAERLATEVEGDTVTAEAVAGAGAQLLQRTMAAGGSTNIVHSNVLQYLLRRPDGKLDHLLVIQIDLQTPHDPPRRLFVPVRARQSKSGSAVFLGGNNRFTVTSRAAFLRLFGQSPSELNVSVTFNPTTPPREFAQEIKEKGLWEPAGNPSGNHQ